MSIKTRPVQGAADTEHQCDHCRDSFRGDLVTHEDKVFCCRGCRSVYLILSENDMLNYYALNETAGISLRGKREDDYRYLDTLDIRDRLIDYADDKREKVCLLLPQIHCSSCLWLLENLHRFNDGIINVRVHYVKKEAFVTYDPRVISLSRVALLLSNLGYAPAISLYDLDQGTPKQIDRSLPVKMAVAAFAFGNIMLFSFPEYLGLSTTEGDHNFSMLFGYLNLAIALPVLLYSARDILKSAWRGLLFHKLNMDVPLSLGIVSVFTQSTYEVLSGVGAGYFDSFVGLVFFLLIGRWFQNRTYARISFDRDYRSYFPISANVIVDGKETPTPLESLEVGDVLMVRHGDLVPADAILISDAALIDYSFVTGEAQLVDRRAGEKVFAGGRISGSAIEILLSRKVSNSYLTQLWNEDAFSKESTEGQVSRISNRMAGIFTMTILSIACLSLVFWLLHDPSKAIFAFTSVLIIACPCAIALSIPFTLGEALRLLSSRSIFVRDTSVIETLARIDHLVFDKTGTLTETDGSQVVFIGKEPLSDQETRWLGALVAQSSHPVSREILASLDVCIDLEISHFHEEVGRGIGGYIDGHHLELHASFSPMPNQGTSDFLIDGRKRGSFRIARVYRHGVDRMLAALARAFSLSLLSGDHDGERHHLRTLFGADRDMHFQQSPHDKLHFVEKRQKTGQKVAMIGDGLNDAGALKQSDVGIVISADHSAFSPACDIIVADTVFDDLDGLFRFAKSAIKAIYICYAVALVYNVIGLSFAVSASLSPIIAAILMPLSSISIVLVGVGLIRYFYQREF